MIYPTPPDTGFENAWVLKVDSLGCQGISDCWVGNNEIIVKTFTPDKPYVVYPNPATDNIAIEFHENSKGAKIEVFDQFGRSQYKSQLTLNKDQVEIDISKWKPGLYIIRVILDDRILGSDKILKFDGHASETRAKLALLPHAFGNTREHLSDLILPGTERSRSARPFVILASRVTRYDIVRSSAFYRSFNLANLRRSCFCPIPGKNTVAFLFGPLPSRLITLPLPNRSCSTSIPG